MKKFALVLGVIASALVLASCASKGTADQSSMSSDNGASQTAAAPHHTDYKGEMNH